MPMNAVSGLKEESFAPKAEVHERLDFHRLPKCPVVGQQLVDWLFAPGKEALANPAAAAELASKRDLSDTVAAIRDGEVGASGGAAGPVTPTAQHLGLILELLLLAWPTDGSTDRLHRTETQQQEQQEGGKEEVWDEGQDPQQGKQGKRLQEQQQQHDEQASPSPDEINWQRAVDWLLLLGALLQQATAAEKQQFLMEQGALLLQLLYHLLLKDPIFGGEREVQLVVYKGPFGHTRAEARASAVGRLVSRDVACYTVSKLVVLVLQALMYEPVRWSGTIAEALVGQARMVYTYAGGSGIL
jgi:hypothetical protein